MSNTRFFLQYLKRHRISYALGIVCVFLTNWLAVNIPVYIGNSVDLLSGYLEQNQAELVGNIQAVIVFAVGMVFVRTLSRILFFNPGRAIERDLKNDTFAKLTQLQKDFYAKHATGSLISIVNNDINGVRAMAGVGMLQSFNIFFALSLTPYKMWQISPSITLYCIAPVLLTFTIVNKGVAYMRRNMRERMLELQGMSSNTVDFLSGIEVLKSHRIEAWAMREFEKDNSLLRDRSLKISRITTIIFPLLGYIERMLKVIILAVGGFYLIEQQLSLGDLTAMLAYAALLAMPFISLGMIFSAFQTGMVGLESIRRVLDQAIPVQEQQHLPLADRERLFSAGIEVKDLTYRYPDSDEAVLKNISFSIYPGQVIGVLGQVGSGKTTLVNCLNRYLEVEFGHIAIDHHDITQISKNDLRSAVRTITQEPFLFSDTVVENVQFGASENDQTLALEDVLYQSDILDEVEQFPDKELTLVGEKGILLSGGQKQRLSLSRALYTPCKLMILDNVLSAVDNETERFLLKQIFDNMRSQSTLIVSHRASVLEKVDYILVLEGGEIVARGTHHELLQSSDLYRDTWRLQQYDRGEAGSSRTQGAESGMEASEP